MLADPTIEITHQIISLSRDVTQYSKSPMWRCETLDSQRVNIFSHTDPAKDTFKLFADAGYADELRGMETGHKQKWSQHPIGVTLRLKGQWLEVVAVASRPAGACPDEASQPNPALYRQTAQRWAESILTASSTVVIWDSETTGLTDLDEIITLAAVDAYGGKLIDAWMKPRDLGAVARSTHVHGITPEELADAPTFDALYADIRAALDGKIWVIYNAAFDTRMLDLMCRRYGYEPIRPVGLIDAIQLTAEFIGDWDNDRDSFSWPRLSDAAERLGVVVKDAHNALGNCYMTRAIVEKIADWGQEPPF